MCEAKTGYSDCKTGYSKSKTGFNKSLQKQPPLLAFASPPCAPSTCARTSESSASVRVAAGESAVGASRGGRA
jgi:hypothetical protein